MMWSDTPCQGPFVAVLPQPGFATDLIQILLLPLWINGTGYNYFRGTGASDVMDEKINYIDNDIDSDDVNVSSDPPCLDLRAIRENAGLTLGDISSSTRVSSANLQAIEGQRFELLPEPIYARSFIRAYAGMIDLNSKDILSLYDHYLKGLEPDESRNEILKKLAENQKPSTRWVWLVIASCAVVLTCFFFLYQWSKNGVQEIKAPAPVAKVESAGEKRDLSVNAPAPGPDSSGVIVEEDNKTPPVTPSTDIPEINTSMDTGQVVEEVVLAKATIEQPKKNAVPDAPKTVEDGPYKLAIKASELTWIRIIIDDSPSFEVTLRPGERMVEKSSEKFDLIIGNAGGVDISFRGKSLGVIGERGEVVHLTLPAGI